MRVLDEELEDSFEINIVPMIDVIFAILAFFIVSTLFLARFEGLSVNLPKAETSKPQPDASFTIAVDEDGRLFLNQEIIQLESLKSAIQQKMEPDQIAIVTIHADELAYHGQVVAVMDEVRTIEGAKLGIATQPKER